MRRRGNCALPRRTQRESGVQSYDYDQKKSSFFMCAIDLCEFLSIIDIEKCKYQSA